MPNINEPTIEVSPGVRLEIDWPTFSKSLVEVIIAGAGAVIGNPAAAIGAAPSLISAASAIKLEDSAPEKAWRLFWLCLGSALQAVSGPLEEDKKGAAEAVRKSLKATSEKADHEKYEMPVSFLERPTTLPLYRAVRDELISLKGSFTGENSPSDDDLAANFDSYFNKSVFEIWSRRPEIFQSLYAALTSPGKNIGALELQWAAYRQQLTYEFNSKPVFGQETSHVALADLYVPLRARCHHSNEVEQSELTQSDKVEHCIFLDEELDAWALELGEAENIKLVGGGPGSGKSTTLKAFACRLAARPSVRPLYIPLQHISLEGDLRDIVGRFFTERSHSSFTASPLGREAVEDGPPILLIFDGLDEIALPGHAANEIAQQFVTKVIQLQAALNGDATPRVKVLISGRMPSFQAAQRYISTTNRSALEVCGYAPVRGEFDEGDDISDIDQRPRWWERYSSSTGAQSDLPAAMQDIRLADITNEPLLCYLLALSGYAVDNWEEAAENRNRIYAKLIDEIYARAWGDPSRPKNRQGPGKDLTNADFNHLMDTIALAAWLGGDTRLATEAAFKEGLKIMATEKSWENFCDSGGKGVANLALNFYLKSADDLSRGFEFTHKSFGDYLAARAIISISHEIVSQSPRHLEIAARFWLTATNGGVMTQEILSYIRDEVRLISAETPEVIEGMFGAFQKLVDHSASASLPAHTLGLQSWKDTERSQKNSEICAWAVLNSCVRTINDYHKKSILIDISMKEDPFLLSQIIRRLNGPRFKASVLGQCLSFIDASGSDLFGMDLSNFDFRGSNLQNCDMSGTHVMSTDFTDANLQEVQFQRANMDGAMLAGASLEGAHLVDARIVRLSDFSLSTGTVTVSYRTLLDGMHLTPADTARMTIESHPEIDGNWEELVSRATKLGRSIAKRKTRQRTLIPQTPGALP